METKREMPDEVKNEIMPDGKKRVVTEKIPEKYLKEMEENGKKKGQLVQQYLQMSVKADNMALEKQEMLKKIKEADKKIGNIVEYAFKKLKLHRRKERIWQFRKDSFVGVYNPPRPKNPVSPEPSKPKE